MHQQLQEIADEYRAAGDRLRKLVSTVPEQWWTRRPDPDRWSVAECVAHLNLTSAQFLPRLDQALAEAEQLPARAPARYRRDPVGWLLWRMMGPPVRVKTKTSAQFMPTNVRSVAGLIQEFERLQQEQLRRIERADGLPLTRVRVASPFNEKVKYNLYSCFCILPRHEQRHLWQAEQVAKALRS
jgi:hypothetical protein